MLPAVNWLRVAHYRRPSFHNREQTPLFQHYTTPQYAGFWIRVLAYIIDSILLAVVSCPLALGLGALEAASNIDPNSPALAFGNLGVNAVSIAAGWLYFGLMESSSWQASVGKRLVGIKVSDLAGNRLTFGRATGRYFGKVLSGMICGIGFIMVAFSEQKQGLHDLIASTLVVFGSGTTEPYLPPPPPKFDDPRPRVVDQSRPWG